MEKQEIIARFEDLEQKSYRDNRFCFTNFLSATDASYAFAAAVNEHAVTTWGGAEGCERVMVRFGDPNELGYEEDFPICILKIEPLQKKFADELTHRDYLGSLMNLGIERDMIGDIAVRKEHGYIFVVEHIAPYICEQLDRIRHTSVTCRPIDEVPEDVRPELREEKVIVANIRIDSIIAHLFHLSRGASQELIAQGNLLVNGKMTLSASLEPKEGDVIAVRGHGKFVFCGKVHDTKKGRQVVLVQRYI